MPNGGARAGARAGAGAGGNGGAGSVAALSSTPRDLYMLWQEYQVGIGGRKAMWMFSAYKRGCVKHKYIRHKTIWTTIYHLVCCGGLNSNVAIAKSTMRTMVVILRIQTSSTGYWPTTKVTRGQQIFNKDLLMRWVVFLCLVEKLNGFWVQARRIGG